MICKIEECERHTYAKGVCSLHYSRLLRHGNPNTITRNVPDKNRGCNINGCILPHKGKGFCDKHYSRWRVLGNPVGPTSEELFWAKVNKAPGLGPNGDCWEWIGGKDKDGYGKSSLKHKTIPSHRLVWYHTYGKFPTKQICHTCDNPPCVRPSHLFEGTNQDNVDDKVAKNRHIFGIRSPNAVLNDDIVKWVLQELKKGRKASSIAKELEVTGATISAIKARKSWKHVNIDADEL